VPALLGNANAVLNNYRDSVGADEYAARVRRHSPPLTSAAGSGRGAQYAAPGSLETSPWQLRWSAVNTVSSGGQFWTPAQASQRIAGHLVARPGEDTRATLDAALAADLDAGDAPAPHPAFEQGDVAGAMKAGAAASVARSRPITVWGELDNGELVSAFDARNVGGFGPSVNYVAPIAIIGANVTDEQLYIAVRFLLDDRAWLSHLRGSDSSEVEDDHSVLSVEASDDGNWLVYTSATPETLAQLEIRVVTSCLALAQLALMPDRGHDLCTRAMQVRIDAAGEWMPVFARGLCANPAPPRLDTLLPRTELTVERFARWIVLNDKFDGLAWAVARRMDGIAVQLQVQLLTSLVEGFHRRLASPRAQQVFPNADKSTITQIREAAAQAAVDEAARRGVDPQEVGTRVANALNQLGDMSFRERAEQIVAEVCDAVPEVRVSIARLGAKLTEPRNDFAHQLPLQGKLASRVDRWVVVSRVTPWLLRALLLLNVGIDPSMLRQKYLENQSFALHQVQSEIRVRRLGWDQSAKPQAVRTWKPSPAQDYADLPPLVLLTSLCKSLWRRRAN
jgi:hypothetical protein